MKTVAAIPVIYSEIMYFKATLMVGGHSPCETRRLLAQMDVQSPAGFDIGSEQGGPKIALSPGSETARCIVL